MPTKDRFHSKAAHTPMRMFRSDYVLKATSFVYKNPIQNYKKKKFLAISYGTNCDLGSERQKERERESMFVYEKTAYAWSET